MAGPPILVLGATGVFGSRACRLLVRHGAPVVAVARDAGRLAALARETGVATEAAPLPEGLETLLARHRPAAVIDACGPFQARDYAMPRAAIAAGVPYFDISDGREDVAAIGTLDRAAKAAGVAVIAGASSVPGLSSAVVDHLAPRLATVEAVETVIAPGNDAPRGRAVIESILSYVGRPFEAWRDGGWATVHGWQDGRRVELGPLGRRAVAACDVPDLALFPNRYPGLRSVAFHAGLELPLHHHGLGLIAWAVRRGIIARPERLAGLLMFAAEHSRRWGSATGAMRVTLAGPGQDGRPRRLTWTLVARDGDGPMVPVMPAVALALAVLRGTPPAPGARPCLGEAPLAAIAALFDGYAITTTESDEARPSLFREALGGALDMLPAPVRALHEPCDATGHAGLATVEHGDNLAARLAARLGLLPEAGQGRPVSVAIVPSPEGETWRRDFDGMAAVSRLERPEPGHVEERYGPLVARLALEAGAAGLDYRIAGCRLLGLPLPRWLGLHATGAERLDGQGRFTFDVAVDLPFGLRLVRYRGWLARPAMGRAELRRSASPPGSAR